MFPVGYGLSFYCLFSEHYFQDSDLDIVIKFREGKIKTLFDLIRLQQELESILKIKVDINTYDSLSPLIKKEIEKEMRVII
nr:nucleotidyltransferase domain-containing protein [Caldanaerovirga acetigignens]